MHYQLMFPGKYIKAVDFKGKDRTVTIVDVKLEELDETNGGKKAKGVVYLQGQKKAWVLNRTNAECLVAMFGKDTDGWKGKRITLYPAPYEGDVAIRVRGSPDIAAPKEIVIQLPKKKPFKMTMHKTGAQPGNGATATAPQTPAAAPEPTTPPADLPIGDINAEPPDEAFPD